MYGNFPVCESETQDSDPARESNHNSLDGVLGSHMAAWIEGIRRWPRVDIEGWFDTHAQCDYWAHF